MGHISSATTEKSKIKILSKEDQQLQRTYKMDLGLMKPMCRLTARVNLGLWFHTFVFLSSLFLAKSFSEVNTRKVPCKKLVIISHSCSREGTQLTRIKTEKVTYQSDPHQRKEAGCGGHLLFQPWSTHLLLHKMLALPHTSTESITPTKRH